MKREEIKVMKKWIAFFLTICMVFSTAVVAFAQTQTEINAITVVLNDAKVFVSTDVNNVAAVNVQLPLHRMIEAGIFQSDTTDKFVEIVKKVWDEITKIPAVNQTQKTQPTAINITYQVKQAGDLLILSGVGVLPAGKPAIKEDYTYATLLQKKLEDQVMKKLAKMVLDIKGENLKKLKEQTDTALQTMLTGFETADLATLRARIQAYINVSNLYKTAQVEYENLKKYNKEVVEKNYNTKYTLNKKTTDPKKDDDFYFGDWDKYFQNKLSVIFKLLEKQGNKGTKNAASQQLRNLQKKFGDSFKVYMEKYLGKDYEEYLEDLFDYKIDDDNDDKDYQKSNKKNNNNNGKNGKGKND
jgi:hypothetical protein